MEITTKDFSVSYNPDTGTVYCSGSLRLDGLEAYRPVQDVFNSATADTVCLAIDLSQLEFLNSSGISMLSMFVVGLRDRGDIQLILKGSSKILWQTRSLKNLQRLMLSIEVILE